MGYVILDDHIYTGRCSKACLPKEDDLEDIDPVHVEKIEIEDDYHNEQLKGRDDI